jgi:hypothetical protein
MRLSSVSRSVWAGGSFEFTGYVADSAFVSAEKTPDRVPTWALQPCDFAYMNIKLIGQFRGRVFVFEGGRGHDAEKYATSKIQS